jgi:hypothetical protein
MKLLTSVLLLAVLSVPILAQTSTITGVVMDQSKAVIPNAMVTVTCIDTDTVHKTQTNSDGYFTVASLPALSYTVSAEVPGMKRAA